VAGRLAGTRWEVRFEVRRFGWLLMFAVTLALLSIPTDAEAAGGPSIASIDLPRNTVTTTLILLAGLAILILAGGAATWLWRRRSAMPASGPPGSV
jgi:hypothetical protein